MRRTYDTKTKFFYFTIDLTLNYNDKVSVKGGRKI